MNIKNIRETNDSNYIGIINEEKGGVTFYVHESIAENFCQYLVWEKPLFGKHIDSINHEDYDGWQSRGWDLLIFDLEEHSEILKKYHKEFNQEPYPVFDIVIDDVVIAKNVGSETIDYNRTLIEEFLKQN